MPGGRPPTDPIARFVAKVTFTDGCWLSSANINQYGYSRFNPTPKTQVYAHRYAWEIFVGPIPEGFEIDHVAAAGCANHNCVNPDHLEPVTHAENVRRSLHVQKTHCKHGHPRTAENTYTRANGSKHCRICVLRQQQDARRRKVAPL